MMLVARGMIVCGKSEGTDTDHLELMKDYHKRIILISGTVIALICMRAPAEGSTWKFKPASGNAVPWNREAGDFNGIKTTSGNSTLKMRMSGQVSQNKEETPSVSENDTGKKETAEKNADKSESTKKAVSVNRVENDWRLILVNKQNPIPDDYEAVMVPFRGGVTIREEIKGPLDEMFDAAASEGVTLQACSGYRSHEHQQALFDRKIRTYTGSGLSYLDAFRIGSYSVIIPGTSEHELGMALDIVTPSYTALNEGFERTEAGRWLKNNAFKYGFILRYPKGKEYITGIIFEPWHYRYVGKEAATEIKNRGLTLEEYLEELELY
ncbi:MAG: M15 family metallopeptidase [Lachnospiraceae bacterium]|nr:M15 family metallopeptidase [Lachnospiraceae bacterium]